MIQSKKWQGFSLIEMMVAIAVASFVMIALVTIMSDTLATSRVQDGAARMQENGRYALARIRRDIHQMLYQPMNTAKPDLPKADSGGVAVGGTVQLQSTPRSLLSHLRAGVQLPSFRPGALDVLRNPGSPNAPYLIPPNFFISAHECATACAPPLNAVQAAWPEVPASGTSAGDRMPNTDILTSRFLASFGVRVSRTPGNPRIGQEDAVIRLENGSNPALAPLSVQAGDPMMLASTIGAEIFSGSLAGGQLAALGGGQNIARVKLIESNGERTYEARVYNLRESLTAVSYYVRLKQDPNDDTRLVGVLVRQSGALVEELIEGVERFDLRFGVTGNAGLSYMNADELYNLTGATQGCPAAPDVVPGSAYNDFTMGCLWRNVASIEVSLLLNTIDNLPLTGSEVYRYSGASTTPTSVPLVDPAVVPPSSLPAGSMLRREFRETIQLKNGQW